MANRFDIAKIRQDLDIYGVTVVDNVVSPEDCDDLIKQLREWLGMFGNDMPDNTRTIIHKYSVGHLAPCWEARLKCKPLFEQLWGTRKLLTSFDGISIAKPPEQTVGGKFAGDVSAKLHLDQGPKKRGLHAYQGALYLEEAKEDDWCFQVLDGSHHHHEDFFKLHKPGWMEFKVLTKNELSWYKEARNCRLRRIAVKKGGMVLWDSRLVHDGARPKRGRAQSDRWRFVCFISMTPAIWSSRRDLETKKKAYENLLTSYHWSSTGVHVFKKNRDNPEKDLRSATEISKTVDVQRMAGVIPYDFHDCEPNGPTWRPIFVKPVTKPSSMRDRPKKRKREDNPSGDIRSFLSVQSVKNPVSKSESDE